MGFGRCTIAKGVLLSAIAPTTSPSPSRPAPKCTWNKFFFRAPPATLSASCLSFSSPSPNPSPRTLADKSHSSYCLRKTRQRRGGAGFAIISLACRGGERTLSLVKHWRRVEESGARVIWKGFLMWTTAQCCATLASPTPIPKLRTTRQRKTGPDPRVAQILECFDTTLTPSEVLSAGRFPGTRDGLAPARDMQDLR